MKTPPNILWICTDQQRFDTLGCYGNPHVLTPNLDRLAASGVLFENAFCQSPVCTPSRASFLTGRYPRATRCRQNGQDIPNDEVLVTRLINDAGYLCGLSGKLHISACNPATNRETERRIDDGYDVFHWSHHPYQQWGTPANEYQLWLRENGRKYRREPFEHSPYVYTSMPQDYHHSAWCVQKAVNFIEECTAFERPWLFSINMFDPHHPFDPSPELLERYLDRLDDIPLPNYVEGELANKPIFQQIDHKAAQGGKGHAYDSMSDDDHRLIRAAYWAMIEGIDMQVGRLLDYLAESGVLDNTLVIFTSDHGEMLGDHGLYYKGPFFYEPAVHVPLIMAWPGHIAPGTRSPALVELVDIAPTLLDVVGLERYPGMQGQSLWPLLMDTDRRQHRQDIYCEYYNASPLHTSPMAYLTMLRTDRHKLVAVHGLEQGELYDLQDDPGETRNQWDNENCAAVKMRLLKRLCDRMAWTVDPLPARLAPW
jgi:arylsulfatase